MEGGSLGTLEHATRAESTEPKVDLDALARAASTGDAAAFDALARASYLRIHRWAVVHVGDADEADDVTQRVLLRLYRHVGRWRGQGRFGSWLYRVTANEAATWRTRSRRIAARMHRWAAAVEADAAPAPSERIDRARLVERARHLFRGLPPRQREVMGLIDFQGHEPAEVAEMLNLNPNTVRANLFKARRAVRRGLLSDAQSTDRELPEAG